MSAVRDADPVGKATVTAMDSGLSLSAAWVGDTLILIKVGAASPSVRENEASDTVNPVAVPDTVKLSTPSPATLSSVPAKVKEPAPLRRPAGMVTVKSETAE